MRGFDPLQARQNLERQMNLIDKYNIKPGQVYYRADGTPPEKHHVQVVDTATYAFCDDVVIRDVLGGVPGEERRIDAFKLVMTRYSLAT